LNKKLSQLACIIISALLVQYRVAFLERGNEQDLKVTTWDAFGYYLYLPSVFIYHDVKELKWVSAIEVKYSVTGGELYQVRKAKNGNYVCKYLGGVAIIEAPFFLLGDGIARAFNYKADGFSAPYQYAVAFGIILWFIVSLFVLRKFLLNFFSDVTTSITLLLLILATNILQYVSIDTAQSHAVIFPLYVYVLYATYKWHQRPQFWSAALTGFIIGLAIISRPTEAIMILIPLLWNTHTKEAAKEKWKVVKENRKHVLYALLFLFIGILPQLIYWQYVTGFFIYDVGSKWNFMNPFFRVLFGPEKGWFVYTPVTILFIAGFFFIKNYPFKKSVIYFCLLNIYIIIAWHDWKYGASFSTRALSHSYPVFALALAALIERIIKSKWRWAFYGTSVYLICLNLFLIKHYNAGTLNFTDFPKYIFFLS
jgi:hypothetical protein